MATIKKTPPIFAKGRWILKLPFIANPTKIYTCIAIRSFADVYKSGADVYRVFYLTMGVQDGVTVAGNPFNFIAERLHKPNIITLQADDGETIYVPDTFIQRFPDMGEVKYSHLVLSVSLGAVPDYLDLDEVKDAVAQTIASRFGFVPQVREHRAPSTDNPTPEQHEAIEAARLASLNLLETDAAKVAKLLGISAKKQQTIDGLVKVLRSNGINL